MSADEYFDIAEQLYCYYKTGDLENSNNWAGKVLTIEPKHRLANLLLKRLAHLKDK